MCLFSFLSRHCLIIFTARPTVQSIFKFYVNEKLKYVVRLKDVSVEQHNSQKKHFARKKYRFFPILITKASKSFTKMNYTSTVELLALNDDCFLELFKYLSTEDLCAVKQTNQRLWNLTEYYFQTEYQLKEKEVRLRNMDGAKLKEVLNHCGQFTRKLLIDSPRHYSDLDDFNENSGGDRDTYISHLIAKYCTEKLNTLRLESVFISGLASSNLTRVLNNLNTIELNKCYGDAGQFMNHCPNIRTIIQRNCAFFLTFDRNYLLQNEHRNLECLIIHNENQTDLLPEVLLVFFEIRRNLKCFHYINRYAPTPTELLPIIIQSAKSLEELCIELDTFSTAFVSDLRCLHELSSLKRLEFNTDEILVTNFINELAISNCLECIGISDLCLDESVCQAFMKFTNLKVLKFTSSLREFDEFSSILSQRLSNLEELYLVQCAEIYFCDVMAFVENCPKLLLLYLYETPYAEWSSEDSFEQFSIDFVHLFKIRIGMSGAAAIDICFDSKMVRLIEEHVWKDQFEWFTKNGILRLKIADADLVNGFPGFCPKINDR